MPALGALLVLGVASGVPFDLAGATLQSWITDAAPGLKTSDIGAFSLVALPYSLKPLWSPLLDRFTPPLVGRFGRRRGWIILAQLACAAAIACLALVDPQHSPVTIAILALALSFFSATQDIVVDAWRSDVLPPQSRALGAAAASWGYRMGILLAGYLAPVLATGVGLGWSTAYLCMALIMATGPIAMLITPREPDDIMPPRTLREAVVLPFANLWTRPGLSRRTLVLFLVLVLTYKLGDAFGSSLLTTFLQRGLGFSPDEGAAYRKWIGIAGLFVGMLAGGFIMIRVRVGTALLIFGVMQAVTNLTFVGLADTHRDFTYLAVALAAENIATGLGSVAFVAFLTSLCDRRFSATQYALLASLASLGRVVVGPIAGPTAEALDWAGYYWVSVAAALPGLVLVVIALPRLRELDQPATDDA